MMRRTMLGMAIIGMMVGTAPAARLCRDTKGLFTPCIGERPLPEHHRRHREDMPATADAEPATDAGRAPATVAGAARAETVPTRVTRERSRPPIFAKTHLCRDTKGLFTPCPR